MTLEEVQVRVEAIRKESRDDEAAHSMEDDLYEAVLRHHAALGCPLATEALKTKGIDFERWCA